MANIVEDVKVIVKENVKRKCYNVEIDDFVDEIVSMVGVKVRVNGEEYGEYILFKKATLTVPEVVEAVNELLTELLVHAEYENSTPDPAASLKSEVERLEKALAAKDAEYDQALQDKSRYCNIAVDKIRLEHRAELALLHSSHEQELAEAKIEVAREIFAELDTMDIRIVRLRDAIKYIDLVKKYKYKGIE